MLFHELSDAQYKVLMDTLTDDVMAKINHTLCILCDDDYNELLDCLIPAVVAVDVTALSVTKCL